MWCWKKRVQTQLKSPLTVKVFAPAKINLTLHVTGQRADGYHLLDSLVVFADFGDQITVAPAQHLTLDVDGPFARDVPVGDDNLVLRAARLFNGRGATIKLTKNLPVASGLGGGSSDAAAVLRALCDMWDQPLPRPDSVIKLGADVPVCLFGKTARMSGIGEVLAPVNALPPLHMVLVNPGLAVSTPKVFSALNQRLNPKMDQALPHWDHAVDFYNWLSAQRNDLQSPACALSPVISNVLAGISATADCRLARLSGSGATCFGLYDTRDAASSASDSLSAAHPDWWVQNTFVS